MVVSNSCIEQAAADTGAAIGIEEPLLFRSASDEERVKSSPVKHITHSQPS